MIGLAVLSYSMDEIMKMYGGVFLYSNPVGSYIWAILSFATSQENLERKFKTKA